MEDVFEQSRISTFRNSDTKSFSVCPCCGIAVVKKRISLWCSVDDLSFLGPGVILYFRFVQGLIIFTTLLCLFNFVPIMIINTSIFNDVRLEYITKSVPRFLDKRFFAWHISNQPIHPYFNLF